MTEDRTPEYFAATRNISHARQARSSATRRFVTREQHVALALPLPQERMRDAMTNSTAFLLVLALTGAPIGAVLCVTECPGRFLTAVHRDQGGHAGAGLSMAAGECSGPSLNAPPYVVQHRAALGAAVLHATLSLTTVTARGTDAPALMPRTAVVHAQSPAVLRI